jgi:hypothetical protein
VKGRRRFPRCRHSGPVLLTGFLLAGCAGSSPTRTSAATHPTAPVATTTTTATPATAPTTAPVPTTTTTTAPAGPARPTPVQAPGWTTVAGDGAWQAASWLANGTPVEYTTLLHPGAATSPAAMTWLDTAHVRLALYAGTTSPSGYFTAQGYVAPALVPSLVATFNSGFQLPASRGGWYADGRAAVPLRAGAASLVISRDGSATVGMWGRDVSLTADVVSVRQNLELLVDVGVPASDLAGSDVLYRWGYTLGGGVAVWRSAIGIDAAGHLLYLAGPGLTPTSLASILVAAGAVRAMELDINPMWVTWDTFATGLGGRYITKLLSGMSPGPTHYLSPETRDFFAVFRR